MSIELKYNDLEYVESKKVYEQLPEFTRIAKYAQYNHKKKRRETWNEQVDRVFKMHKVKLSKYIDNEEFIEMFNFSKNMMLRKNVLGSQRGLQFGGPAILNKNARLYNCCATYIDRPRVFQEIMYCLLCGEGVGFSVQTHHIDKLPNITRTDITKTNVTFVIPDSIEGWSDAIGVLLSSYFVSDQPFPEYYNKYVNFDYSLIRPKGASISHMGGKAPGSDALKNSLSKIQNIFETMFINDNCIKIKPIDAYDIIMHSSDAVLSGGIRRSATLAIFSLHDEEMLKAKTGDWYIKNPQRARSNNSALLLRDQVDKEKYITMMESVKQFGEPGMIWSDSTETLFNPCVEIGLYGYNDKGQSGFHKCNLSEINMTNIKTEQQFYDSCRAASIIGTFQAAYTDFPYLGSVTEEIVRIEALIGVSMTGMCDTPEISFNPKILEKGATIVKETNAILAKIIDINTAARTTCIKPSGTASCLLGTSSGIHPHHSKRYFRRVQANKLETPLQYFKKYNPHAVEESVWSSNKTDDVITFLCKANPNALLKSQVSAIEMLKNVKLVQEHWVTTGRNLELCVKPWLNHNVSNTITVNNDEWNDVTDFIYTNRHYFAGISLLSSSGDMIYNQAPFQEVLDHTEIVQKYGAGSILASGLIVHALDTFNGNLYAACDTFLGYGEKLEFPKFENDTTQSFVDCDKTYKKIRWIAQASKFTKRHFGGDKTKMTFCLKSVDAWKKWCDLKRTYQYVNWEDFYEEQDNTTPTEYIACSGNSCEKITF